MYTIAKELSFYIQILILPPHLQLITTLFFPSAIVSLQNNYTVSMFSYDSPSP